MPLLNHVSYYLSGTFSVLTVYTPSTWILYIQFRSPENLGGSIWKKKIKRVKLTKRLIDSITSPENGQVFLRDPARYFLGGVRRSSNAWLQMKH